MKRSTVVLVLTVLMVLAMAAVVQLMLNAGVQIKIDGEPADGFTALVVGVTGLLFGLIAAVLGIMCGLTAAMIAVIVGVVVVAFGMLFAGVALLFAALPFLLPLLLLWLIIKYAKNHRSNKLPTSGGILPPPPTHAA